MRGWADVWWHRYQPVTMERMNVDLGAGRFAPSPSGELHLGNLRTALLAWLLARTTGRRFIVRMEDLDRVVSGSAEQQLVDLAGLGLDWDGPVVRQSQRVDRYADAIEQLDAMGRTYPCFCTRREIQEAVSAPHSELGPAADGAYPGTCRTLSSAQIQDRLAAGRPAALRLKADIDVWSVQDVFAGTVTAAVDDFVLRRNDGVAAYNLAVVIDDAAQGVNQVVRGDDLLFSAPRQAYLGSLWGLPAPLYAHVPLALNGDGRRLAKRDGAVTLRQLVAEGMKPADVLGHLAQSAGLTGSADPTTAAALLAAFDARQIRAEPWVLTMDHGSRTPWALER